jgi:hypothetical protein
VPQNKVGARPIQPPLSSQAPEVLARQEQVGNAVAPVPTSTRAGDAFADTQAQPPIALNSSQAEKLPPQRAVWAETGLSADEARQRALDARKMKLPASGDVDLRKVRPSEAQLERFHKVIEDAKTSYDPEDGMYNRYGMYLGAQALLKSEFSGPQYEGLSAHELMELVWFTDFGYQEVNDALWSRDPAQLANAEDGIVRTAAAANRFPAYEGLVLRSDFYLGNGARGDPQEVLAMARGRAEQMKQDGWFVTQAFWSTTKAQTEEMMSQVTEGLDSTLHYEIVSKTGRDLHGVNPGRSEEEVLILPGTLFRVLDVKEERVSEQGPGSNPLGVRIKVRLEEVPVLPEG